MSWIKQIPVDPESIRGISPEMPADVDEPMMDTASGDGPSAADIAQAQREQAMFL